MLEVLAHARRPAGSEVLPPGLGAHLTARGVYVCVYIYIYIYIIPSLD